MKKIIRKLQEFKQWILSIGCKRYRYQLFSEDDLEIEFYSRIKHSVGESVEVVNGDRYKIDLIYHRYNEKGKYVETIIEADDF